MATRKKSTSRRSAAAKNSTSADAPRRKGISGKMKTVICSLLLILLGGLIFQFDYAKNIGIHLLKYKKLLPRQVVNALPGGSAADGSARRGETLKGEIIEVYDGDTAVLLLKERNHKYKVRFYGIDAPEKDQPYGTDSRDALRHKILGKTVTVEVMNTDAYSRSVGKVMLGGRNINYEMIREGHAWFYKDYAKHELAFAEAERLARRDYCGLWRGPSPQPPWEFRRQERKKP